MFPEATLTVFYAGRIVNCAGLAVWPEKDLMEEAFFYAACLETCRSLGEVKRLLYGPVRVWPPECREEDCARLQLRSRRLVIVDLTGRRVTDSRGRDISFDAIDLAAVRRQPGYFRRLRALREDLDS